MRLTKYLKQTFSKGNFIVKFIKSIRLILHTFYFFLKIKIGSYPPPKSDILNIGFIDKNRLIHVQEEFIEYFSESRLYKEGEYKAMKIGMISLAINKNSNQILLKKKFIGIQKYNKFYNELICLNRLSSMDFVPKIKFVNYKECSIYMEYIDGVNIRLINSMENYKNHKSHSKDIINKYKKYVGIIHDNGVLIYDLRAHNMMIYNSSYYLIDFADSLYFGKILSFFIGNLKKFEMSKMHRELELYFE